jgi:hypothetical protein
MGFIVDKSEAGLCILLDYVLPAGALVEISLPSRHAVLTGEIAYCRQTEAGYIAGISLLESTDRAQILQDTTLSSRERATFRDEGAD